MLTYLIHIYSLECISTSKYYCMVLIFRFTFAKLRIPRQFYRIYFLKPWEISIQLINKFYVDRVVDWKKKW